MKNIAKLVSTLIIFVFSCSVHASTTIVAAPESDMGSMMLFSAGLVGLFVTRKHMKSKVS